MPQYKRFAADDGSLKANVHLHDTLNAATLALIKTKITDAHAAVLPLRPAPTELEVEQKRAKAKVRRLRRLAKKSSQMVHGFDTSDGEGSGDDYEPDKN